MDRVIGACHSGDGSKLSTNIASRLHHPVFITAQSETAGANVGFEVPDHLLEATTSPFTLR